jgi:hypothetical protein
VVEINCARAKYKLGFGEDISNTNEREIVDLIYCPEKSNL